MKNSSTLKIDYGASFMQAARAFENLGHAFADALAPTTGAARLAWFYSQYGETGREKMIESDARLKAAAQSRSPTEMECRR